MIVRVSLIIIHVDGALKFAHVCVDNSQTVLEHHRFFIPSTLVSQVEENNNPE